MPGFSQVLGNPRYEWGIPVVPVTEKTFIMPLPRWCNSECGFYTKNTQTDWRFFSFIVIFAKM